MKIIAHRGASIYAPENTMSAFNKAIQQKADAIELDVRLTKDGIPVVCHDATIKRTSNGKGAVHNLTLKQLKKYDFGTWFSRKYKKEQMPTLEEVLQLFKNEQLTLNIELKNNPTTLENFEEKVLKLVHKYRLNERVIYSSFDHLSIKKLFSLDNHAKVGLILHLNLVNLFTYLEQTRIDLYSIHPVYYYTTEEMVKEAHRRHLHVFTYTVDQKKLALYYKNIGVDGLITNNPLILKRKFM